MLRSQSILRTSGCTAVQKLNASCFPKPMNHLHHQCIIKLSILVTAHSDFQVHFEIELKGQCTNERGLKRENGG